jgi:HEAT repeat protein/MFS family permease
MQKHIAHAGEKILNISPPEYARTGYAWLLKFLLKAGLIAGWTAVISIFVLKYGVSALPFLFMIQAALAICGMLLFSFLVNRIEIRKLAVTSAFGAGIMLFIATFFSGNEYVFFPLVLLAAGIFLPQLSIFLSNFIEDFFTPSECERTFPIIESAETIGGLVGGLILAGSVFGTDNYRIIYVWILFIFAFLAALFIFQPRSPRFYRYLYEMKIIKRDEKVNWDVLKRSMKEIKKMHFLQILVLVFFIQWMMTHLLEFQYVKVVEENVMGGAGGGHEAGSLSQGLGLLQIIFSGSAILMQLLMASRILRYLGTFGGFLFHALISFMSALMMMFGFGYFTTVLTKNNFELSGVVNKNAYESSYYAFRHSTQKSIREFFEGLMAPLGTLVATLLLLLVRGFFIEQHSLIAINLLLVLMTGFVLFISVYLQQAYTDMVRGNLFGNGHRIAKMNSIEILSQKGHGQSVDILIEVLRKERDEEIKVKVLYALRKIGDIRAIPAILRCLHDPDRKIVLAAISALASFPALKKRGSGAIFSRQKVADDLKAVFESGTDFEIKVAALRAIAYADENAAAFLLHVLEKAPHDIQAECIKFMGSFADPAVAEYLDPYLDSSDPFVRAQAIVVTANSRGVNGRLHNIIETMLSSKEKNSVLAASAILPVLNLKYVTSWVENNLINSDEEVRLYASLGLLQAGRYRAGDVLADLLLSGNELILSKARHLMKNLGMVARHVVSDLLQRKAIGGRASDRPNPSLANVFEEMDEGTLKVLMKAYEILELEDEKEMVGSIVEYREFIRANRAENEMEIIPELAS